jgi:hypothetical protein
MLLKELLPCSGCSRLFTDVRGRNSGERVRYALLALLPVALVHALTGVGLFCSSGYCLAVWQHEAALYGPDGKFLTGWEFNADLRSGQ